MSNGFGRDKSNGAFSLGDVQIQPLCTRQEKSRARRLLGKHHYLGDVRAVGEQLWYAITGRGVWLGVLVFCAASRRLRARDQWIGWSEEQRRRRLPLLVNNCRFLLRPDKTFANLASRSLSLCLHRLSADWQARYGHPVVLVENYLGSAMVDTKTNEIPVARELFKKLDLDGRKVSLDALHTQDHTARDLVLQHGADYLLTVKDNQPTVRANIEKLVPAPPAGFSPSAGGGKPGRPRGI